MTGSVPESLRIPSRFNGPKGSGNGGYSAGVVASLLGGEAEVSLRRPVPLDTDLRVVRDDGEGVRVLDGEALWRKVERLRSTRSRRRR